MAVSALGAYGLGLFDENKMPDLLGKEKKLGCKSSNTSSVNWVN